MNDTGRTGTSSSAYYASRGRDGHLTYMMSTPPPSPPPASPDPESESESEDADAPEIDEEEEEEEDEIQRCTAMRSIVYQEILDRFSFLPESSLVTIAQSDIWNIDIELQAQQPLVQTQPGVYKPTPVRRISIGMIPFSSGPYEIMRFTRDGCYGDKQEFETRRELLNALERYLRHLEPA